MRLRTFLQLRYHHWARAQRQRLTSGVMYLVEQGHTCWMPRGNLYTEHDIGNKLVRYPDSKNRAVRVTKVRDTGGVTFYSLAAGTPLL